MRSRSQELEKIVERYIDEPLQITESLDVPQRESLRLGESVAQVEATVLSIDIRQFSGMTNHLGRKSVVEMLKALFDGSTTLVAANDGYVADFNGDGMITLFSGPERTERAFACAAEICWFIREILRPRFRRYYERTAIQAVMEEFDAGCGIDDGPVLVGRVGSDSFSDTAWVGRSVNTSAKLCKVAKHPESIIVTHDILERLEGVPSFADVKWSALQVFEIGGVARSAATTSFVMAPRPWIWRGLLA